MKKAGILTICGLFAAIVAGMTGEASARSEYKKAFDTVHEKSIKSDCYICHIKGEKKDVRNDFGKALVKAGLTEDNYKDNIKSISDKAEKEKKALEDFKKALAKVLKEHKEFKEKLDAKKRPVE